MASNPNRAKPEPIQLPAISEQWLVRDETGTSVGLREA
jgi:hypothetical protein